MDDLDIRLKNRAERILGNHLISEAVGKVKALIGPPEIPNSEPMAQAALNKLRNGDKPTPMESAALELVIRIMRPVIFSTNNGQLGDFVDDAPGAAQRNLYPAELKDGWSRFRQAVRPLMCSIGRIETKSGRHVGTGFLVQDGILATNRHVLTALTFGTSVLGPDMARVCFRQEYASVNDLADYAAIEGVVNIHRRLDVVLLAIAKQNRPTLTISDKVSEEADSVVAVGFGGGGFGE